MRGPYAGCRRDPEMTPVPEGLTDATVKHMIASAKQTQARRDAVKETAYFLPQFRDSDAYHQVLYAGDQADNVVELGEKLLEVRDIAAIKDKAVQQQIAEAYEAGQTEMRVQVKEAFRDSPLGLKIRETVDRLPLLPFIPEAG